NRYSNKLFFNVAPTVINVGDDVELILIKESTQTKQIFQLSPVVSNHRYIQLDGKNIIDELDNGIYSYVLKYDSKEINSGFMKVVDTAIDAEDEVLFVDFQDNDDDVIFYEN